MSDERAAFAGQITDLPVVELLRTIHTGTKTGVARFQTNLGTATVWFRDGTLVDADMGRFHMGDAVRRLMSTDAGSFEVEFKPVTRRRLIEETTSDLLDQGAAQRSPALPPRPKLTLPASAEKRGPGSRKPRAATGWRPTGGGRGRDGGGAGAASPDMLRRLEALRRAADKQPPRSDVLNATAALGPREQQLPPSRRTGETPQAGLEALNRIAQKAAEANPVETTLLKPPAATPVTPPEAVHPPRPDPERLAKPPGATPVTPPQPVELAAALDLDEAEHANPAPATRPKHPVATNAPAETSRGDVSPPRQRVVDVAAPLAVRPPAAPTAGAAKPSLPPIATPPRKKATVAGMPAMTDAPNPEKAAKDNNGWSFVDPNLAKGEDDDAPDRTLMRMGPIPFAPTNKSRPKRPGGRKPVPKAQPIDRQARQAHPTRVDPVDDLSDPLPIGTSWSAPAHISTPRSKPIDSEQSPSAGGEIGKGGRSGGTQTVVAFAPGRPREPDPGVTMTEGFRPITEAEASGKVPRAANPGLPAGRAASVAEKIGLAQPTEPNNEMRRDSGGNAGAAQVGRYEVLLRIARGGMGTVYLCQVTGAGGFRRLFALKVIRDHLSRNDEYVRMLLQEARIASRLHHPNVVGIVDIGNLANQHYLVMDYVEGCTLSELLKVHRKTRPPHLIIPIVLDALTGLHAAHTLTNDDGSPLTLVHCDFSPQNMLVGTNGICRITDFGIAKASNALPERSSITRGKPAYLAPEQITGRPFDHRADIFAAGVVLWNGLTGEQLFKGDSPEEVLNQVLNMPIAAPSTVGLRPPKKLDKVVLRALERDPTKRYQTAEEMLIELRKVAIGNDLLAPSSEVAQWVADTFGAQLELRRQAAGLAPGGLTNKPAEPQPVTALALRDDSPGADDSATHALLSQPQVAGGGSDASQTMMLQSGKVASGAAQAGSTPASDAVLGDRARKIVLAMVISAVAGLLAVAVVRPELLTGGMLDEEGEYMDLSTPDDDASFEAELSNPPTKPEGKALEGKAPEAKAVDPKPLDAEVPKGVTPEPTLPDPGLPSVGEPDPTPAPAPVKVPPPPKPKADKPAPKPKTDKPKDDKPAPKPKADKPADKPKDDKPAAKPKGDKPDAPDLPSAPVFE